MTETLNDNDSAGVSGIADISAAIAAIQLKAEHYEAVQAALAAVQAYDGSVEAREPMLARLVALDRVIEGFRRPARLADENDQAWASYRTQFEHAFMAHALTSDPALQNPQLVGAALPTNLSIFGLLHYIGGDYWIRVAGADAGRPNTAAEVRERQSTLLQALEKAGATVVPLSRVAVPPEPNQVPQTGSGAGWEEPEFDDRAAKILKLLKDVFNMDAEDLLIRPAEVTAEMVRQVPYLTIEILPRPDKELPYPQICGKQILVCDEVENASFVSHYFLAPLEIAAYGKGVLEHYCGATRIVMRENTWEADMTAALRMPPLEDRLALTPEQIQEYRNNTAQQAMRLTQDLFWHYAFGHFIDTGIFPTDETTPNGFPEGENWSTWLGALQKGQRALSKGMYGNICAQGIFQLLKSQSELALLGIPLGEGGKPLHDVNTYLQGLDGHRYPTYESGVLLFLPEWEQRVGTTARTMYDLDQALSGFGGKSGFSNLISLYVHQGVWPELTPQELFNICIDHIHQQETAKEKLQFPDNNVQTGHPRLPSRSWTGISKLLGRGLFDGIHSLSEFVRWGLVSATRQFHEIEKRAPETQDLFPGHPDFKWEAVLNAVSIKRRPTFDELMILAELREKRETANSPQEDIWQTVIEHVRAHGAWPAINTGMVDGDYITWRAVSARIMRNSELFAGATSLASFIQIRVAAILPPHIQQHGPIPVERNPEREAILFGDSGLTEGQVMAASFGNNIKMRSAYTDIFQNIYTEAGYSFEPPPVSAEFVARQSKASQASLQKRRAEVNQGVGAGLIMPMVKEGITENDAATLVDSSLKAPHREP